MKNLLILHLESVSRLRLATLEAAFPNTRSLLQESLVFDHCFSSATSTRMVITYLFHGNDFEYDAASRYEGMRPVANNRNFFSVLRERGYSADVLCLSAFHPNGPVPLEALSDELPPVWSTNDFPTLFAKFDQITDATPFAIYVWDLVTHVEHSRALAPQSAGLTDQTWRACAVADDAVGVMLSTLRRKGLLDNTTVVVYGDHGDDFWTHGFKAGMVHATEPYTDITWVPLGIRDPGLASGHTQRLASTIDFAPTCLALLGIDLPPPFAHSGTSLLEGEREFAFSQNFAANQPDDALRGIRKAFSVSDRNHTLLASSRGLELYAHRLDPGNQCNLLHFFDLDGSGRLHYGHRDAVVPHFRAAMQENPHTLEHLAGTFQRLRAALASRVAQKRAWIAARGVEPAHALDPASFDTVNRQGRDAFFGRADAVAAVRMPAFETTYKLR